MAGKAGHGTGKQQNVLHNIKNASVVVGAVWKNSGM